MRVSRRGLIRVALVTMGGAAAAYAGYVTSFDKLYHWLKTPPLAGTPTGPLSDHALRTLLAATEALLNVPIDVDHYADYFRWYGERLRGYRTLYEGFTVTVNRSARQSFGRDFVECDRAARQQILGAAFRTRRRGLVGTLRTGILDRNWQLFDHHIVRPVIRLFAHTDAWRLAGYDAWPATPRGLERYRQPPVN